MRRKNRPIALRAEQLETRDLLTGFGLVGVSAGQSLTGTINIAVTNPRLPNLASVEYLLNGHSLSGPITRSPYIYSWNTLGFADGRKNIEAIGRDSAGHVIADTNPVKVKLINSKLPTISMNVISPDLSGTLSGIVSFQVQVNSNTSAYSYGAMLEYVDGIDIGMAPSTATHFFSSRNGTQFLTNDKLDTTKLSNGTHTFTLSSYIILDAKDTRYGHVSRVGSTRYLRTSEEMTFTVDNGQALRDIRSEFSTVYLDTGQSQALSPVARFTDGTQSALPSSATVYTSLNPSVATVSPSGVVTGVGYGTSIVTISALGRTALATVTIAPPTGVPHFGRDGSILTKYDPANSIFATSLFYLNGDALDSDPRLPALVAAAGINTLTTGFYQNPADGGLSGLSYSQWLTGEQAILSKIINQAKKYNMSLLLTGDDIARTAKELNNTLTNPWAPQALQAALSMVGASKRVIGVDMVDETDSVWGDNPFPTDSRWAARGIPDNAFAKLMSIINAAPNHPNISWPTSGGSSNTSVKNWLGNSTMSNYASLYWAASNWESTDLGFSAGNEYLLQSRKISNDLAQLSPTVPKLMLNSVAGQFYWKTSTNSTYTPGQDVLINQAQSPNVVAMNIFNAAVMGMAGVREYAYDGYVWSSSRSSGALYSIQQTGANPFTIGTDRWQAMATANNLIHRIEPQLFQAQMSTPDLGDDISTTARQGDNGRLLMIANNRDNAEPVHIDLTPYIYGNGSQVTLYRMVGSTLTDEQIPESASNDLVLAPGEGVVYVFQPTPASPAIDATPPAVTLLSPLPNSATSGLFSITATATDDVAVDHLTFFVDGQAIATVQSTNGTYQAQWTATGLTTNAYHSVSVIAYDAAGNSGEARTVIQTK